MDNDDATVGTILSRREAFSRLGKAGAGLALGGWLTLDADAAFQAKAHQAVKLVASPAVTEGPFFVDEKLNRSNLLEGTTRPSVVLGVPMAVEATLYRLTDGKYAPLKGASVDVWQCDARGVYSDVESEMNHENTRGQTWLRGAQTSDADGLVRFQTIFPGWYPGRATHIHFKVRQPGPTAGTTKEFTSQLFFDDVVADRIFRKAPYLPRDGSGVRNRDDMVYTERQVDGTQAGDRLLTTLKASADGKGYVARLAIALTDDNLRAGRRRGGRPPGGF